MVVVVSCDLFGDLLFFLFVDPYECHMDLCNASRPAVLAGKHFNIEHYT